MNLPIEQSENDDRFAVALPFGKSLNLIKTYPNREALEHGYFAWRKYAAREKLILPVPIEILDTPSKSYRILEDMLKPYIQQN